MIINLKNPGAQRQDVVQDKRFSEALAVTESIGKASNIQTNESESENLVNTLKSDFNRSESASSRISRASEELRSIQTSRSNYENEGHNIDLNLNNKFAEWGINKYGVEKFESLIENDREAIRKEIQTFLKEQASGIKKYKFNDLIKGDHTLSEEDHSSFKNINAAYEQLIDKESIGFVNTAKLRTKEIQNNYLEQSKKFDLEHQEAQGSMNQKKDEININSDILKQDIKQKVK